GAVEGNGVDGISVEGVPLIGDRRSRTQVLVPQRDEVQGRLIRVGVTVREGVAPGVVRLQREPMTYGMLDLHLQAVIVRGAGVRQKGCPTGGVRVRDEEVDGILGCTGVALGGARSEVRSTDQVAEE